MNNVITVVWFSYEEMTDDQKSDLVRVLSNGKETDLELNVVKFEQRLEDDPARAISQIRSFRDAVTRDRHIIAGDFSAILAVTMLRGKMLFAAINSPEFALGTDVLFSVKIGGIHNHWEVI